MFGLFKSKETCIHCNEKKTRRKDANGNAICSDCEIKLRMRSEKTRKCPVDGTMMIKEPLLDGDIIIDRCQKCNGVWLDHEELESIQKEAAENSNSGFGTGFVLGLAIN